VLLSADPYHQAFVPPDRRVRAFQCAVEVFGSENVIGSDLTNEALQEYRRIGRDETRLAEYSRSHPPQYVGRAGEELAQFATRRPLEELADDMLWHHERPGSRNCRPEFDPDDMWEIHVDPHGNILTCCGITIGCAHTKPLIEWMAHGFHTANDLVRMVYDDGPYAYLDLAESHGYKRPEGYAQKCHLCWEVRKFLRPLYPETFGPQEIYEPV